MVKRVGELRPEILTAPASAMSAALQLLAESGGADAWLSRHGLNEAELSRLRARLVE